MTDASPRLIYFADAMCSWCYGFQPVVAAIRAVAEFACEHAERLLELDVNPLLADAEGALAVDALIRLANG